MVFYLFCAPPIWEKYSLISNISHVAIQPIILAWHYLYHGILHNIICIMTEDIPIFILCKAIIFVLKWFLQKTSSKSHDNYRVLLYTVGKLVAS